MLKKRKIQNYIKQIANYVDNCDTPKEVRQNVNYAFMSMMVTALISNNIPPLLAAQAAARMTVDLPYKLHIEFPDEFVELIRLMSKSLTVLYETVQEDFAESLVESVFLSLADDVELRLSYN